MTGPEKTSLDKVTRQGVCVELYGIPRQRAGQAEVTVCVGGTLPVRLADVVGQLTERFPELAVECFDGPRLRPGYVANLGGERFVSDPHTPLPPGACLLILSADAGG